MERLSNALNRLPLIARVAIALLVTVIWQHFAQDSHAATLSASSLLTLGAVRPLAKTYTWLREAIKPADANQPEAIPHVIFDMQTYPQAGTAALQFFQSTAANLADPTLSNLANGQLEALNYFEIHRAYIIIDSLPTLNVTAVITGGGNDLQLLHKTARGTHTLSMAGKTYFGFKMAFFGRPGGPVPHYSSFGTGTAANNTIVAGETAENGGFPVLGNIVIPPAQQIRATLNFSATAISAATFITVAYMGVLHRPVR